jgi:hypothetical protein
LKTWELATDRTSLALKPGGKTPLLMKDNLMILARRCLPSGRSGEALPPVLGARKRNSDGEGAQR